MATKDQPKPLMPHATATWLVDNTALSFEQIAEFCGLHILEVQAMADDLAGSKYTGRDPVHSGELTQGEIELGQADASYSLKMHKAPVEVTRTKGPRYTPVSKRQDKPDGIAWILRNHPEVSDAQIGKLIGTTRNTIAAIRDRSHWNIQNIQPKDPVTLGLCSQRELDAIVAKAAKKAGLQDEAGDDARLGDDREARAEVARLAATVDQLGVQRDQARADLQRYEDLARQAAVSAQQREQQAASASQLEAQWRAAQASLESARVRLDHTVIRAPISGRPRLAALFC